MGPDQWVGPFLPIFFKGRTEKIKVRIELGSISLTRLGLWAIRAWVGLVHLTYFGSFIFIFLSNLLMTTCYFLFIKNIFLTNFIIKNIGFAIMKKYKIVVYKKKNSY